MRSAFRNRWFVPIFGGLGLSCVTWAFSQEPSSTRAASNPYAKKAGTVTTNSRASAGSGVTKRTVPTTTRSSKKEEPAPLSSARPADSKSDTNQIYDANVKQAQQPAPAEEPRRPVAGLEGLEPTPELPTARPSGISDLGPAADLPAERQAASQQTSAVSVSGNAAAALSTTDAGDLIGKSEAAVGVETQKRSPIANETRVRGYHLGQLVTQADGAFWFPARQDLDTFLSKIDSGIIRDIIIIKGPYAARYGPGFSFIDIETNASPRYGDCWEVHGRTVFNYDTNGKQFYGRQIFQGGDSQSGFRLSYGHRTGSDYEAGDGTGIPSSYKTRDIDFVWGTNLSDDSKLEIGAMRLDQTDLEFPGQIFDTDFLVTDGYRMRYTLEEQFFFDKFQVDAWYNRTRLEGNAQGSGKRRRIPQLDQSSFTGFTDIDLFTTGYRAAFTWGREKCPQLTLGTDLRYLRGELNEIDTLFLPPDFPCVIGGSGLNSPIPRSDQTGVGGLFLEYMVPVDEQLTVRTGARGDYVHSDLREGKPPTFASCPFFEERARSILETSEFEQDWGLFMGYVTAEYKADEHWTWLGGLGHGQRAPTLTELYAMEPFLAILQQGFTSIRGNPNLDSEKLFQIDLGVKADYEWFRGGMSGFYAFVNDYITYQAEATSRADRVQFGGQEQFTNALTVRFVNTDLATLSGGELYGEVDVVEWLTSFATLSYVEGRDHSRGDRRPPQEPIEGLTSAEQEPLPGIAPIETHVGLRVHEPQRNPRWAVEFAARIVEDQDRVASSLKEVPTGGFTTYDLRSYWQARENLTLTAGIENVFDKHYREHLDLRTGLGVFQPGRNVYVGMEVNY